VNLVERTSRRILLWIAAAAVVLGGCALAWLILTAVGLHLPPGAIVLGSGAVLAWLVLGGGSPTPTPPTAARPRAPESRARWADLLIAAELLRDGLIDEAEFQQVRARVTGSAAPKAGERPEGTLRK
jgi:hypothetical protein